MDNVLSRLAGVLPDSLKDSGMQALVVTKLFGNVVKLLSNLIIARFLSPEDFAIFGIAFTVIFTFEMISDGGFRAFILRHQDGGKPYLLKTLWTIKFVRNVVLAFLIYIFSDEIAGFFNTDELSLVLQVLSVFFITESFIPIGFIAIERQNRIARVMYVKFVCVLLSTVFSIIGVLLTGSYWFVIFSMILNPFLQVFLGYFFIGFHGTGFGWDRGIAGEFLKWAKFIIPSSVITLILMQFDKVILGRILSASELGLYFIAFSVSSAAKSFTVEYARGVLQPYLSIVHRQFPSQYVEKLYEKKQKTTMFITFSLGLLSGASFLFFDVLYDERYLNAGFYLALLLVTPIMTLITYPSEVSLILYGQVKSTLTANIIRLVWFFCGALGSYLWWGQNGLLLTIALVELCPAIYMLHQLKTYRAVRISSEISSVCAAIIGFLVARSIIGLLGD
jgi:O-antigen/teichoic acid export membrane protein